MPPTTSPTNRSFTASDSANLPAVETLTTTLAAQRSGQALRRARGAARRVADRRARGAGGRDRSQRRRQDDAAVDPGGHPAARRGHDLGGRRSGSAGSPSSRRSTASSPWRRTSCCSRGSSACADPEATVERMLELTDLRERADDQVGTLSGGNRQRVNIAIGLLAEPEVLLLDEPSTGLDPRQRERLWEFILRLAARAPTVVYATHHIPEADRYANQLIVLADGERVFDGSPRELEQATGTTGLDFEQRLRRVPAAAGPLGALAAAQGPAHPAPLAVDGRAARDLPDRDRGADRLRALARPGQAEGGVLQRAVGVGEHDRAGRAQAQPRRRGGPAVQGRRRRQGGQPRGRRAEGARRRRAGRHRHPQGPRVQPPVHARVRAS